MSNSIKTASESGDGGSSSSEGDVFDLENADASILDGCSKRIRVTADYLKINQSSHVGAEFKELFLIGSSKHVVFSAKLITFTEKGWPRKLFVIVTSDHLYEFKNKCNPLTSLYSIATLKRALRLEDLEALYVSMRPHLTTKRRELVIRLSEVPR
jgi:hypothetical protein